MIKQITEKSIGRRISFHILYSPYRWMFFKVIGNNFKDIQQFTEFIEEARDKFAKGIYTMDVVMEDVFQILYDEREITEEKVIEFAKRLGL